MIHLRPTKPGGWIEKKTKTLLLPEKVPALRTPAPDGDSGEPRPLRLLAGFRFTPPPLDLRFSQRVY